MAGSSRSLTPFSIAARCALLLGVVALLISPTLAQSVRQITRFDVTHLGNHAVDDVGTVAFFISSVDPLATNPQGLMQVFKKTLPGGALVQVTTLDADAYDVSVSDDGGMIAFVSAADPLATNSDGSSEVFIADGSGGSLVQLTDHPAAGGNAGNAVLAGGAGKVLFSSTGDLAGSNPSGHLQLFVIGTDGTGLVQLTAATGASVFDEIAINDLGVAVAFTDSGDLTGGNADGSMELYRMSADGTGLTQVTSTTDPYVDSMAYAGKGTTLAYSLSDGELYSVPWGSTTATLRADWGFYPSMNDNATAIYFICTGNPNQICSVDLFGGDPEVIWDTASARGRPVISGAGNRLLTQLTGEGQPFVTNPDALQLLAMDASGHDPEQVVDVGEQGLVYPFEMTANGSRIVVPWGDGSYFESMDLYLVDTGSGEMTQLTDGAAAVNPAISDDGNRIVFSASKDLTPAVCPGHYEGIYSIGPDGSGLLELAPDPSTCDPADLANHPMISNDGASVVFQSVGNASGTNTGGGVELYSVPGGGGSIWQTTDDDDSLYKNPRIDGTGTWVVHQSGSNITGQNADGGWEVFRIQSDGSGVEQITADPNYVSVRPDISADGATIVYHSDADPLGTNADHNQEIFVYRPSTGITEQLTVTTSGDNTVPRVSPDGGHVAFYSNAPLIDTSAPHEVYRIEPATGDLLLASAGIGFVDASVRTNVGIDVDDSGNVAFSGYGDLVGTNRDGSLEVWLAEFDAPQRIEPGAEDPTVVRWSPLPWALSYDVIRGDVANLAAGMGDTVDLGAVACVENDSDDAMTVGNEDDVQPSAGQVLFYLFRGYGGNLVGDGEWGEGSGGDERIPGGGSCADGP